MRSDRPALPSLLLLHAMLAVEAASGGGGVIWSATGGGWRSMAANSAYSQVFSRLGLLGAGNATSPKVDIVATTSGSSWWSAQFFFSPQYYSTIVDGTPSSLGEFTQTWLEAYASTQANLTLSCAGAGPFEAMCLSLPDDSPLKTDLYALSVAEGFDYSWPNIMYAMFAAASEVFGDDDFVEVPASYADKVSELAGTDICFHTSLLPNARAKEANTITYLVEDVEDASSAYTVPLPSDWCVGDGDSEWYAPFPGGNVYSPAPEKFVGSASYAGFPLFPPPSSAGLYTTPEMTNLSATIASQDMHPPFGGTPTAVQISTASSSTLGYISEELPSYFAQYMSLVEAGIDSQPLPAETKIEFKELLKKIQDDLWSTGLLANAATCSAWTDPDPIDMPPAEETSYWFTDGGYTDGPSAAIAIARYQKLHGTDDEIKLIISNNNYVTNNLNNVLGYFPTTWNQGVAPGDFVWAMGVGEGPQNNPQRSNQIFEEYMDEESLEALLEPIEGTNLTMATFSATTVNNDAYGVVAGQSVSIALLNLNSDVPTFILTAPVIEATTPAIVSMVENIASSDALSERISAFVGTDAEPPTDTDTPPTTAPDTSTPMPASTSAATTVCMASLLVFALSFVLF